MNGKMKGWIKNGWMDSWMDGYKMDGWIKDGWMNGSKMGG